MQAWQTPEHRVWTAEEWGAQPPMADDDEEGEHSVPAAMVAVRGNVTHADAAADATGPDCSTAEVTATKQLDAAAVNSSQLAQAAAPVADRDGADMVLVKKPAVAAPEDAAHDTSIIGADADPPHQPVAEAVSAEATADEAAAACEPPAAQVAKAALALKALTVKERLAACVATERHRITFGKARACTRCHQRL